MKNPFKIRLGGYGKTARPLKKSDLTGFKKGEFGLGRTRRRRPSWKRMIKSAWKD